MKSGRPLPAFPAEYGDLFADAVFLGEGFYGQVFRARDRQTQEWVAVKILKAARGRAERLRLLLLEEVDNLQFLNGAPNVLRLRHYSADAPAYVATEFVEGRAISAAVRDWQNPSTIEQALVTMLAMGRGLLEMKLRDRFSIDCHYGNVIQSEDRQTVTWLDNQLCMSIQGLGLFYHRPWGPIPTDHPLKGIFWEISDRMGRMSLTHYLVAACAGLSPLNRNNIAAAFFAGEHGRISRTRLARDLPPRVVDLLIDECALTGLPQQESFSSLLMRYADAAGVSLSTFTWLPKALVDEGAYGNTEAPTAEVIAALNAPFDGRVYVERAQFRSRGVHDLIAGAPQGSFGPCLPVLARPARKVSPGALFSDLARALVIQAASMEPQASDAAFDFIRAHCAGGAAFAYFTPKAALAHGLVDDQPFTPAGLAIGLAALLRSLGEQYGRVVIFVEDEDALHAFDQEGLVCLERALVGAKLTLLIGKQQLL